MSTVEVEWDAGDPRRITVDGEVVFESRHRYEQVGWQHPETRQLLQLRSRTRSWQHTVPVYRRVEAEREERA